MFHGVVTLVLLGSFGLLLLRGPFTHCPFEVVCQEERSHAL